MFFPSARLHRAANVAIDAVIAVVALLSILATAPPSRAQVTELFISEYVEGSSFNKAIEIYNGTGASVDLAAGGYRLVTYFNGNLIVGSNIALDGVVEPGGVWVVARDRATSEIAADQRSNQNFFNGNDTVLLMKDGAVIDAFGRLGENPGEGWTGEVVTHDRTLRRRPSVCRGDVFLDDPFIPSSDEWEELPTDTFDGLGSHQVLSSCESCPVAATLSCETPVIAGANSGTSSSRLFDRYTCLASSYGGPEVVYAFEPPTTGRYRLFLDGLDADLDLVVAGPGDCRPNLCAAASDSSGTGQESLRFDALAGEKYFVVVDGVDSARSAYTLEITCPVVPGAAFTSLPGFPTAGEEVRFFDTSQGDPTSWSWDFGDGETARGKNPRHTFSSPGSYTVVLDATNATGGDTARRDVEVAPPVSSVALGGPSLGRTAEPLTFTATAQGCVPADEGWEWLSSGGEVEGRADTATLMVSWSSTGVKRISARNRACGEAVGTRTVEIAPAPAPQPPPAPADLVAVPLSATEVELSWRDPSASAETFRVERRRQGGAFELLALVPGESKTAEVSLADVADPTVVPTTFRVFASNAAGLSPSSNETSVTTEPGSCDSSKMLCLLDKRFELELTWRDFSGNSGTGHPVPLTRDTGYFWFFNPGNVEVMVKVLDARTFNGNYWVFFGALTNVEYTLRVTDTEIGNTKVYFNPPQTFASQGDTSALPGAPGGMPSDRPFPELDLQAASNLDLTWTPLVPAVGQEVLFEDLTEVNSPRVDRHWDFGDGTTPVSTRNDPHVRHRFASAGDFKVTLYLKESTDTSPQTASRQVQVTSPSDPQVTVIAPRSAHAEATVTLAATANADCSPLRPRGWQWDVGDGGVSGAADRSSIDVVWPSPGRRSVTVSNSGCSSASDTAVVEVVPPPAVPPPRCEPGPTTLCLADNRFRLEVAWRDPTGRGGVGNAQRITQETGYFWFFGSENIELVVKVLDGRCLNQHFWVFYGALTNVGFDLTVTDLETGRSKTFHNPLERFASVGDVQALPAECPGSPAAPPADGDPETR